MIGLRGCGKEKGMDKPTNDVEELMALLIGEAEKAAPAIPVAAKPLPVAPSRYKGPPKLVLIQGGLSDRSPYMGEFK